MKKPGTYNQKLKSSCELRVSRVLMINNKFTNDHLRLILNIYSFLTYFTPKHNTNFRPS